MIRSRKFKICVIICLPVLVLSILYFAMRKDYTKFAFTLFNNDTSDFVRQRSLMNNSLVNGKCKGKLLSEHFTNDVTWQPIDTENTMYVISAYYVQSAEKVFIIGAKPMFNVVVICQLWSNEENKGDTKMWETEAKVGTPNDPAGPLPYTATIFECQLNGTESPTHVSLVTKSCQNAQNMLKVNNASEIYNYERRFTICLAPIYSYGKTEEFVEWVELNQILGVEKIVIYNYSVAADIDKVMRYYSKRGIAEIIQWRLPFPVAHHIHYFGQTAALNDCLFRNKQASEFITNIDLDEYIIPQSASIFNWTQLISQHDQFADGYIFRNIFFRREWTNENIEFKNKVKARELGLATLKYFEHEKKIYRAFDRSKYFVRPSRVHYTLIHEIPKARVIQVPTENGLLYHYRNWENYADRQERVKDTVILEKYGQNLIQNVEAVWQDLEQLYVSLGVRSHNN